MHIVYALQDPPVSCSKSLFLMGPTPRAETGGESWRADAIDALAKAGYDGVVFVPEPENGIWGHSYTNQIEWEQRHLNRCDLIFAWVPRELVKMPAFTTNVEFGQFVDGGKLLYGRPEGVPKTRYLDALYSKHSCVAPCTSLTELAAAAVDRIGKGAYRKYGQQAVPLDVWNSPQFQAWHKELREAGNRLDDAELLWSFRVGPGKRFLFSYALQVKVWVAAEGRHKTNEYVFSRTDISSIVPYYLGEEESQVVLVKEYRATGRTKDGFVHELPGGSSFKPNRVPTEVASEEMREETGLEIDASRFRLVNSRQIGATISSHVSYVFAVELTKEEVEQAREMERRKTRHGVAADSEVTYVEVRSVPEILSERLVDWSNVGMILEALRQRE